MLSHRKSRGIAIVAVLISAVVFLGIIIAITGTLSLSSRQSTGDQRVTLEAQYASESGLSRVMAEAQNGLLQNWTSLLLNMTTTNATDTTEVKRLAALFCNYTSVAALPTLSDPKKFCEVKAGGDVTGRYDLLTTLIPIAGYATAAPSVTSDALAKAYWADVFSDGPSGSRYTSSVSSGVSYNVSFGMQVIGVDIVNGVKFRFKFKARDAVSTGRYINAGTVISNRVSQRSFPEVYFVDIAPPKLSYFLSLTDAQGPTTLNPGSPVYFTKDTLLDGPVHTNGGYYFRGNPWLSGEVTSAGCTTSYTVDTTTGKGTCSNAATTGFYNDGDPSTTPPTTFTVTGNDANFPGYVTGAAVTATAPEFAQQNLVANAKPKPWNYTGKYNADIISLPKLSTPQRTLAEQSGILITTSTNPTVSGFYSDPAAEAYLQATTDGRSTATSFGTVPNKSPTGVPNTGKVATGQVIQMRLNQKIQRCNAAATGIVVNPPTELMTVGGSKTFTATVSGQDIYTFDYAPTVKTVTWAATPPSTLTTGSISAQTVGSTATPATATYTGTAGYAVAQSGSAPVGLTATTTRGNLSASAALTINPIAPTITLTASPSTVYYGAGSGSTLTWSFGTGAGPFTQLLEQSLDGGATWTTVAGAPTTSDGTTNKSFTILSVLAPTRYRLTASGPTGLSGAGIANIGINPPANPVISLATPTPSGNIEFGGASRTLSWSVTNVNATGTTSGAGNGPFTYVVEVSKDGGGYTTLTTVVGPATPNTYSYSILANATASNISWKYRVRASSIINTVTYSGTSGTKTVTQNAAVNPVVNANFPSGVGSSTPLPYGGGPVTMQWSVTNANAAAAGVGPYKYQVQSSTNSSGGPWTDIGLPTTATSQTLNPTGKIWYNVVATNTVTTLFGADWEEVNLNDLPLPTINLTSSSYNVPVANSKVTLTATVTNGANSQLTVGNASGPLLLKLQTNATPNGTTASFVVPNVNVPGPGYTDYTLSATNAMNPNNPVTKTIRVYINNPGGQPLPPPPVISTFTANPATIYYPTDASTLSWTLSGGAPTTLTIANTVGNQVGSVLGSTSKGVTLDATTDYFLTASNDGGSMTLNTRVTVVPAVAPTVSLSAPTPTPVAYTGGNTTFNFSVTNPTVVGASGAGTGPYTYVIERYNGSAWVTAATQTGQGTSSSYTYAAPPNNGSSDINYPFRVTATNTATTKVGTSGTQNATVSAAALPSATISASPTSLAYTGGSSTISWGVSNATAGAAGTGPYTYTVDKQNPGGGWVNLVTDTSATSTNQNITLSGNTSYRVTAKNTSTGKVSTNLPTATVTVAPPPPPTIPTLTANPNPIVSSSGGNTTFNWTLGGGTVTSLTMDQGVGTVTGTSKSGVFVNISKTYTLTATGPGGTAAKSVTVTVPLPPQDLSGLTKTGSDIVREESTGTITPIWKAEPTWSGGGAQPTVSASDYTVTVSPSGGAVTATPDANGNITLNIGAVSAQTTFTVSASLTINGITKGPLTWKVTVTKKTGGGATLRPRARLTQTTLDCNALGLDGPVSYDWSTFVDYYIDANNNFWRREYPSSDQNAFTRPATTTAAWVPQPNKFNGVFYVDGGVDANGKVITGVTIKGPSRTNITDPSTAPPSIANFAALTIATDGKLTVVNDIKYEDPVCSTSPVRGPETVLGSNNGTVTPAVCNTVKSTWSRNVLGLYSSGPDGIEYKTTQRNTTIQAISLASQGKVQVAGLPQNSSTACPDELLPSNDLGSINIQGGLIQSSYGEFGKFDTTPASNITCGYKRTMTYDIRQKQPQYAPPGFPDAPNAKPTVTISTQSNPDTALTVGQSLPLISGFSRIK